MSTYVLAQPLGPIAYGGVPRSWPAGYSFDDRFFDVASLLALGAQFQPRTVLVTAAMSPYDANPLDEILCDTSGGPVAIDLPVLALGLYVRVQHDAGTSLATNTVTVNGPAGVSIAEPPPNNGTFVASYVFGGASHGGEEARGEDFTWANRGSSAGYLLD